MKINFQAVKFGAFSYSMFYYLFIFIEATVRDKCKLSRKIRKSRKEKVKSAILRTNQRSQNFTPTGNQASYLATRKKERYLRAK